VPSWHYGARAPYCWGGGTILDNLTLLSDDFEADKLNRMLAILGLDKMIAAAENGAAAMLDSKKGGVSGGEKQNIAIVRQNGSFENR
jgi:ABC-type multidrug transport system fused ATPase/permease subunit